MLDLVPIWSKKLKKIWKKHFLKPTYESMDEDPDDVAIDENYANALIEERLCPHMKSANPPEKPPPARKPADFENQQSISVSASSDLEPWFFAYSELSGNLFSLRFKNYDNQHVIIVPYL